MKFHKIYFFILLGIIVSDLLSLDKDLSVSVAVFKADSFFIENEFNLKLKNGEEFKESCLKLVKVVDFNALNETDKAYFDGSVFHKYKKSGLDFICENSGKGLIKSFDSKLDTNVDFPIYIKPQNYIVINDISITHPIKIHIIENDFVVIVEMPFDEYLNRVVVKEIGSEQMENVYITQFIVSRTKALNYLLRNKNPYYDFMGSVNFQDIDLNIEEDLFINFCRINCDSEVIIFDKKIIDALFFSCCAGITENNQDIWKGQPIDYLQSNIYTKSDIKAVRGGYCKPNENSSNWIKSRYKWEINVKNEIKNNIKKKIGYPFKYKILKKGKSGRISSIILYGKNNKIKLDGEYNIRKYFGMLPSSAITNIECGKKLIIYGKGSGHGVGMCQIGMINLVNLGYSPEQIIKFFYSNSKIKKIDLECK